ncbi:MAG: hypothetical protein KME54_17985 [Tolypothrix brevis GSE-NOS-MK-07-07A]|jgi:hypothetical protein|nr:hypothetical protein [Tolypothrix brevis GSE-NOS-MK-07-07A]
MRDPEPQQDVALLRLYNSTPMSIVYGSSIAKTADLYVNQISNPTELITWCFFSGQYY